MTRALLPDSDRQSAERELAKYATADVATLLLRPRDEEFAWCAGGIGYTGNSIHDLLRDHDGSSLIPVCFRADFESGERFYWKPGWMVELDGDYLRYVGQVPHGSVSEELEIEPDDAEPLESDSHTPGQWSAAIRRIQSEIGAGNLRKAVLSRRICLYQPDPWPIDAVIARLLNSSSGTSVFAHQLQDQRVWIGATPEVLYRRDGRQVRVDSLAGTRHTILDGNLFTDKDRAEQAVVTEFVRDMLAPLCVHTAVSPLTKRRADDLEHVFCEVQGVLRDNVTDDDLLAALHPTPAVCGSPRPAAAQLLEELEPLPRELYAGVLGFSNGHHTTAIVALRCAAVSGQRAVLYGGAGIVADSDADREYDECGWKMEIMRRALLDLL
ncbi:MAG: chorismate-binding protein [bacterium]|nr:chorismate-binding protein [bacterium]